MSLLDQPSLTFRPLTLASEGAAGQLAHLPFSCDLIVALRPATLVSLGVGQGQRRQAQAVGKSLQQELQIARGNVEELKQEIERLNLSQADIQDELRQARRAQVRMVAALEQEKSLRAAMEKSRSWQLTRRLRGLLNRPEP